MTPDNESVGESMSDQFRVAFAEDKVILEAIQAEEDAEPRVARTGLDLDASAGLFRRLVNQRIRAEGTSAAAQ